MNTDEHRLENQTFSASPRFRVSAVQSFISAAVIVIGFAVIFPLSSFIENSRPPLPDGYADRDLALQGANLKGYALGFEGLIADWYWMQALQYLGDKLLNSKEKVSLDNLKPLNPRLLYPYLDNATTLDPQFLSVYEYGAIVLPAIDVEKAIKITEKGIENNPDKWRLYQHLGYIYWKSGDYQKASETYERGMKIAGAPPFMKMMAGKMKSDGGSRETARAIYGQMLEEATDEQVKEIATLRLMEIDSLEEREAIRAALQDFKTKTNRCANAWREILPHLRDVKLPENKDFRIDKTGNLVDPSGAAYVLDAENCDVLLDKEKTKIPLK